MKNYIIEKEFIYKGMKCLVLFHNMGFRSGFVGIDKNHILYNQNHYDNICINDENINIDSYFEYHRESLNSFGGKNSSYPIESDLWWFSFNCVNIDDKREFNLALKLFPDNKEYIKVVKEVLENKFENGTIKNTNFVEINCKKLVDQLIEFQEKYKYNQMSIQDYIEV